MSGPYRPASPFTDELAAEIWDARYRWREHGVLRDLNIQSTCERVATAMAAADASRRADRIRRYMDALLSFRVLPDDQILRLAGTGAGFAGATAPAAALNLPAFVVAPLSAGARIDHEALSATARLAVHMLDDVVTQQDAAGVPGELRIGLMGCADALLLLGLRYVDEAARERIAAVARTVAAACLEASISLAEERGAVGLDPTALIARLRERQTAPELIRDLIRHGVRHRQLTAIGTQPWLALLANNCADALDPLSGLDRQYRIERPGAARSIRSSGAAIALANRLGRQTTLPSCIDTVATTTILDQLQMRAAVQPWIDAPISYPLPLAMAAEPEASARIAVLTERLKLPVTSWTPHLRSVQVIADS